MNKQELRQWIIEFAKVPAYFEVIEAIDNRIESVISAAIAEHEQSKWKKYPEEKPEVEKIYWVHNGNDGSEYPLLYNDHLFVLHNIVSFRELPKPYQEGGER